MRDNEENTSRHSLNDTDTNRRQCSGGIQQVNEQRQNTMKIALASVLVVLSTISLTTRATTENLGSIQVRYGNLGNDGLSYRAQLTLSNAGADDIDTKEDNVTIYTCFIRRVQGSENTDGITVAQNPNVTIYHIDGCSHIIVFDAPFQLASGESKTIDFKQDHWLVAYSDVVTNWYIKLGNQGYTLITNTDANPTTFVDPLVNKTQYMRTLYDAAFPWTPEQRYLKFSRAKEFDQTEVQERLVPSLTQKLDISSIKEYAGPYDSIADINFTYTEDASLKRDEHIITITNDGVEIQTKSRSSFLLAKSTVQQLMERLDGKLPLGKLPNNQPRLEYREFMLDISRHFHSKKEIITLLDTMWRYKMNTLHLHFTDDESWAVEIEGLPELTTIGSKQCFDENECANYPQYGTRAEDGRKYLTKTEYIDIVRYALSKGITVLPEVDVPGHSTAAIKAMKIRYQQKPNATDYRLHDPEDTTVYKSVQYFTQGVVNPCINSTYDFIELVITTLIDYHKEAGSTLTRLHLGGDEVPDAWKNSPACNNETHVALKKIMTKRFGELASKYNLSLGFWEDGLIIKNVPIPKDELFPKDLTVFVNTWQTVWTWGGGNRAYNLANAGYKVILTPATYFYMDHSQEPHVDERGYYWATRFVDLLKTYRFRPDNFYANVDGPSVWGLPLTEKAFCAAKGNCPALNKTENVVGGMVTLFSETIYNFDHIANNVFPRIIAAAERMWHEADWENLPGENPEGLTGDFDLFKQVIEKYELPYLNRKGIKYHLSPPGVNIIKPENTEDNYKIVVNTEFTDQKVNLIAPGSTKPIQLEIGKEYSYPQETYNLRLHTTVGEGATLRKSYDITVDLPAIPVTTTTVAAAVCSQATIGVVLLCQLMLSLLVLM